VADPQRVPSSVCQGVQPPAHPPRLNFRKTFGGAPKFGAKPARRSGASR
jgi:hypothetical protein